MKISMSIFVGLLALSTIACSEHTTIQGGTPGAAQANPDTRVSDPDDWGGAGTGDGGGGQGVQCGDKLMVRDVYEAKYNYGRDLPSAKFGPAGTDDVEDAITEFLADGVVKFYRIAALEEPSAYKEYWQKFSKEIVFVPDQAKLVPSKDANSALTLPKDCRLVQIAYWDETSGVGSSGTLYVDKGKWKMLDQFNKGALLAHEYFFAKARAAGFKNSDYVRFRVGQLMSVEGLPSPYTDWVPSTDSKMSKWLPEQHRGFKWCKGHFKDNSNQATFIQYQDKNGNQRFVLAEAKMREFELPPLRATTKVIGAEIESVMERLFAVLDSRLSDEALPQEMVTTKSLRQVGLDREDLGALLTMPLPTKDRAGTFKIINPYEGNTFTDRELKSPAELVEALNLKVQNLLQPGATDTNIVSAEMLSEALDVLQLEVQEFVLANNAPKTFPKWTAVLRNIESKGLKLKEGTRVYLYNTVPMTLFRIKIGSYTAPIIDKALDNYGFKDAPKAKGVARITVGSESEDLSLLCSSWSETAKMIEDGIYLNPLMRLK